MNVKRIGVLLAIILLTMSVKAQNIAGDWKGTLSVQGIDLELVFHLAREDGSLTGTMDVPMQGAAGIPVDVIELTGNEVKLGVTAAQIVYTGELQGDSITGNYEQAGMALPLTLKRFESKLPGNPELVSTDEELQALVAYDEGDYKYSVADYFARPNASSFQLSPNGKYLSYMEKEGLKNHVYIKELATGEVVRAIEEKEEPIKGYGWVNDERLFYAMDHGGNENYHIYAANIYGGNALDLTPFEGVRAGIISLLKEQKDYIIISMNKDNPQIFEPYKLNVVTGELEKLYENSDPANPIQGYDFDKEGDLRAFTKMVNGIEMEFYYKNGDTEEFELKKKTNWDDSFSIISFNYNTPDPDDAYVVTNLDSDKTRIVLYDLKNDREIKEVFSNPDYDVSGMRLSRKRNYEIDYFSYEGEKSVIIPMSDLYKEIDAGVKKNFPGKIYGVVDFDDDENTFLVILQSDKLYGTYYEYDVKTKEFTLLYDLMPQLKEEDMAEMRPITFQSRDGLTIHGYITLPKEALEGKKVPMVVNPHGGTQAREASPVYQVDNIIRPVYVVQGANDPRVNINESDQIVIALRAKGMEIPYMVKYNEGHGFYREENRMDFYSTMMGFLARHLK